MPTAFRRFVAAVTGGSQSSVPFISKKEKNEREKEVLGRVAGRGEEKKTEENRFLTSERARASDGRRKESLPPVERGARGEAAAARPKKIEMECSGI